MWRNLDLSKVKAYKNNFKEVKYNCVKYIVSNVKGTFVWLWVKCRFWLIPAFAFDEWPLFYHHFIKIGLLITFSPLALTITINLWFSNCSLGSLLEILSGFQRQGQNYFYNNTDFLFLAFFTVLTFALMVPKYWWWVKFAGTWTQIKVVAPYHTNNHYVLYHLALLINHTNKRHFHLRRPLMKCQLSSI